MRRLRYEDLVATPWNNGGGVTREVISGKGEGDSGFAWRVSIATIAASGPFSAFPGIDRTIAVLSGAGIILASNDKANRLTTSEPPYAFPGEEPINVLLINGDTLDLNAMSRRGEFRHKMQCLTTSSSTVFEASAHHSIIVFADRTGIEFPGYRGAADCGDAIVEIVAGARVAILSRARYFLITFDPIDRASEASSKKPSGVAGNLP